MKYSKQLHEKLVLGVNPEYMGLDVSEIIIALLDEIERLQAEISRVAPFLAIHEFGGYRIELPEPPEEDK